MFSRSVCLLVCVSALIMSAIITSHILFMQLGFTLVGLRYWLEEQRQCRCEVDREWKCQKQAATCYAYTDWEWLSGEHMKRLECLKWLFFVSVSECWDTVLEVQCWFIHASMRTYMVCTICNVHAVLQKWLWVLLIYGCTYTCQDHGYCNVSAVLTLAQRYV